MSYDFGRFLIDLGFLSIGFWDIVDILVVGYLIYQVYKLLRGSIAFNIFIGMALLYLLWWVVRALKMDLLSLILGQFVSVGVIVVAVVFQPEIRRFLLFLGKSAFNGRFRFLNALGGTVETREERSAEIGLLLSTLLSLSDHKTGALIVVANNLNFSQFDYTGVLMDARLSKELLMSIFNKESPLHDGAVIIVDYKIHTASCVLPVSDEPGLPQSAGLRHRAAVGVTEIANVFAFIVSEETGKISFARQGKLHYDLEEAQAQKFLNDYY